MRKLEYQALLMLTVVVVVVLMFFNAEVSLRHLTGALQR